MTWIAVGIALATAVVGAVETDRVAKKQDRQLAASIQNQARTQEQADKKIAEALAQQTSSNPNDEIRKQNNAYIQTLQQGAQSGGLNDGPGGFSDAYRSDMQAANEELGEYGESRAGLLSRIDAPSYQRQNEGIVFDNLGTELGLLGRQSSGQNYIDTLRLNSIQKNPWVGAIAQAASAYGNAAAGRMGSNKASIGPVQREAIVY